MKATLSIKYENGQAILFAEGPNATITKLPVEIVRDEDLGLDLAIGAGNTAIGFSYDQLVFLSGLPHEPAQKVVASGYFRKDETGKWQVAK